MPPVIPYTKQTWVDGSGGGTPLSAARLGVLEEGILDVSLQPTVRIYHNAAQSIANNTDTPLAFNSERYDQAAGAASTMHDTATNNTRLTCRYAGVYLIGGCCFFASSPGAGQIALLVNGTTNIARNTYSSINLVGYAGLVETCYALAINDYVELIVTQVSGGPLTVSASGNSSPEFWMTRIA